MSSERTGKLLGHLQRAGIDAMPVWNEDGTGSEDELVFFFENDKFMVHVDARTPIICPAILALGKIEGRRAPIQNVR